MIKSFLTFLIPLLGAASICCTRQPATPHTPSPINIRWATAALPKTFDWQRCKTPTCFSHAHFTMCGLTRISLNENTLQPKLVLAEKIKQLSPWHIRVFLRPNLKWSNDTPLEPAHFITAWKSLLSSKTAPHTASLFFIKNAKAFREGKASFKTVGLKSIGPRAFDIVFERPTPDFLLRLAHPALFPRAFMETGEPLTIGPYLRKVVSDSEIVYRVNPRAPLARPLISQIHVKAEESPSARLTLFLNGETDWVDGIQGSTAKALLPEPKVVHTEQSLALIFLEVNEKSSFFQNRQNRLLVQQVARDKLLQLAGLPPTPAYRLAWWHSLSPRPSWLPGTPIIEIGTYGKRRRPSKGVTLRIVNTIGDEGVPIINYVRAQLASLSGIRLSDSQEKQSGDLFLRKIRYSPYNTSRLTEFLESKKTGFRVIPTASRWHAFAQQLERVEKSLVATQSTITPLFYQARYFLATNDAADIRWNPSGHWELPYAVP